MKIKPKFGNHKNCLEATQLEIKKKTFRKKFNAKKKLMQKVLEKFIKNSLKTS